MGTPIPNSVDSRGSRLLNEFDPPDIDLLWKRMTGDKLEALYDLTNDMMKTQPAGMMNYALFLSLPEVDLFSVCSI